MLKTIACRLVFGGDMSVPRRINFPQRYFNHAQEDFMDIKGDLRQIIISTHVMVSWLLTLDIQLGHSRVPGFLFL